MAVFPPTTHQRLRCFFTITFICFGCLPLHLLVISLLVSMLFSGSVRSQHLNALPFSVNIFTPSIYYKTQVWELFAWQFCFWVFHIHLGSWCYYTHHALVTAHMAPNSNNFLSHKITFMAQQKERDVTMNNKLSTVKILNKHNIAGCYPVPEQFCCV